MELFFAELTEFNILARYEDYMMALDPDRVDDPDRVEVQYIDPA